MRKLDRKDCPNVIGLQKNYKLPENKKALEESSYGKCMYYESQVSHVYFGDVEHIKPKADGKYPELEFEWTNLGYVCAKCNNAKRDKYDESCPLIDPYSENPEEFLYAFGWLLEHKNGSERGALTILTVDLNRAELIEKRRLKIKEIQTAVDSCFKTSNTVIRDALLTALKTEGDVSKEFSLFTKAVLEANLREVASSLSIK